MIDLHVHILPGIDDGARSLQDSLDMARLAVSDGINSMVATPHVIKGSYNNKKENIIQAVDNLNQEFLKHGINLLVYPGAEYMLDPDLPRLLEEGQLLTINDGGRYLLIEFPMMGVPPYATQTLYEIKLLGVTPIIAHPERNTAFIQEPELLEPFLEMGSLSQVTSGSLTGLFGRKIKGLGWHYVSRGMCHLISTDAHSSGKRGPFLSEVYGAVVQSFGQELGDLLVSDNPNRIIEGKDVPLPHQDNFPVKSKGMSLFAKISRKINKTKGLSGKMWK